MPGKSSNLGYQKLKLMVSEMRESQHEVKEINYTDLYKILIEFQLLKKHKNILIDENEKLKSLIKDLKVKNQSQDISIGDESVIKVVLEVLKELKFRQEWIEYRNKTSHMKEFYRSEKEVLETIIEEKLGAVGDVKEVLMIMANMGMIRKQDNKIVFSVMIDGLSKRIYMVRRDSVDYL